MTKFKKDTVDPRPKTPSGFRAPHRPEEVCHSGCLYNPENTSHWEPAADIVGLTAGRVGARGRVVFPRGSTSSEPPVPAGYVRIKAGDTIARGALVLYHRAKGWRRCDADLEGQQAVFDCFANPVPAEPPVPAGYVRVAAESRIERGALILRHGASAWDVCPAGLIGKRAWLSVFANPEKPSALFGYRLLTEGEEILPGRCVFWSIVPGQPGRWVPSFAKLPAGSRVTGDRIGRYAERLSVLPQRPTGEDPRNHPKARLADTLGAKPKVSAAIDPSGDGEHAERKTATEVSGTGRLQFDELLAAFRRHRGSTRWSAEDDTLLRRAEEAE